MAVKRRKVLIVDDEFFVGQLIKKLIKWDDLMLECVDVLDNGESAIEAIRKSDLDIVITDIKMPKVSGLDIIKEAKSLSLSLQFIIISGYREFEYARAAMKYGIDHYVLKPVDADDLNEALTDILKIIEEKEGKIEREKRLLKTVETSERIIKTNILKNIIENDNADKENLFSSSSDLFRVINIKLDYENPKLFDIKQDKIALNKVTDITEKILQYHVHEIISCEKEFMNIYFLFNYDFSLSNEIKNVFNKILIKINEYLIGFERYRATIGIGGEKAEFNDIKISIKEAHEAILSRLSIGNNRIIYDSDLNESNMSRIDARTKYIHMASISSIFNEHAEQLRKYIEAFSTDNIKYEINCIFSEITESNYKNIKEIYQISEWIDKVFFELGDEKFETIKKEMYYLMNSCWNINDFKNILIQYLMEYVEYLKQKSETQLLKPVRMVITYIEENFKNKVTLENAAMIVDLNPIYLGTLFKKETGISFSNYVIKVRMELAKKLLVETNYTIAAIGIEVGYKDTKYFSQLFNRTVGVKPALYRRLHS